MTKDTSCVIENCVRKAVTRGLCSKCYSAANSAVKKGSVTWDWLVESGLAKASTRSASPNLFLEALNEMAGGASE